VILDQFLPAGFDLASAQGNFLFIKATPFGDGKAPLDQPLISDTDPRHPVMRLVNLQNITMLRAASLALPRIAGWNWQAPIRSFDHPLMITGERLGAGPSRRVAALAIDITDSDLPLRVAFPLMMSNTIHWLAGEQSAEMPGALAGATIPLEANETISTEPQFPGAPSSHEKPKAVRAGFFQPLRNGFYQIVRPGGAVWLAVNTFDAAESDLRAPDAPLDESPPLSLLPLANFSSWPIWQYLAIAAFALFAGEWWLFHRRRTE
jgi:Ca-activated chloride channel family protein